MNILGIDFGLSRIGLALADSESKLPFPFEVLKVKGKPSWKVVDEIKKVCLKEEVEKIILGIPDGKISQDVRALGRKLKESLKLPLDYQDESLTSKDALGKMIASGVKKKTRREREDAFAAALILERYFERIDNV